MNGKRQQGIWQTINEIQFVKFFNLIYYQHYYHYYSSSVAYDPD